MIDKSLVITRFKKSLKTYDENALIQKYTAKKLIKYSGNKKYNRILEIGCSTGILTRELIGKITPNNLYVIDIVKEAKHYIEKIHPDIKFIAGDIEEISLKNHYDLIISNACLQWCNNLDSVIKKLYEALTPDGILIFSIFADENIKELVNILELPKRELQLEHIKNCYENAVIESEVKKVYFNTPRDLLTHLKYTGANALKEFKFTKSKLQDFEKAYKTLYSEGEKVYLTYNPVYIRIKKRKNGIE